MTAAIQAQSRRHLSEGQSCAEPSRAVPCPLPRPHSFPAAAPHPAHSCRHVLKQAGYQPHDKSIGLFCNVIYIKASGAAGLKRSKMFSKSLSCLCLGGAINSTARTHQPSVPPSLPSPRPPKGFKKVFFLHPRKQSSRCRAGTAGERGGPTHLTLIFSRETEKSLRENPNAVGAQQEGARCPSTAVTAFGLSRGSYGAARTGSPCRAVPGSGSRAAPRRGPRSGGQREGRRGSPPAALLPGSARADPLGTADVLLQVAPGLVEGSG